VALGAARSSDEDVEAQLEGMRLRARYLRQGARVHLWLGVAHHQFEIDDPRSRSFSAEHASGGLTTPLPGVVVAVNVEVGAAVRRGQTLMVIEAMKMEHGISAPFDGRVTHIHFAIGERVPEGRELLALSPADDAAS
jgi:3-methylcrotonyl-CoA carboxylase alpha subunit